MDTETRIAIALSIYQEMRELVEHAFEKFQESQTSNLTLTQITNEFQAAIKEKHGEFVELITDPGFGFKFSVDSVLYQADLDPVDGIESYELTRYVL